MNESADADRSVGMSGEVTVLYYKIEPFCPLQAMTGSTTVEVAAEPVFLFLFAY